MSVLLPFFLLATYCSHLNHHVYTSHRSTWDNTQCFCLVVFFYFLIVSPHHMLGWWDYDPLYWISSFSFWEFFLILGFLTSKGRQRSLSWIPDGLLRWYISQSSSAFSARCLMVARVGGLQGGFISVLAYVGVWPCVVDICCILYWITDVVSVVCVGGVVLFPSPAAIL